MTDSKPETTLAPAVTDEGQQQTTPAPAASGATTFTQADLDRVIAERLKRERRGWDEERKQIEERAKMAETDRVKAEKADIETKLQLAEARALRAERGVALSGRVVDIEASLRLLDDTYLTADGSIDVELFLKRFPFLAPPASRTAPVGAANPDAAGKLSREQQANAALARGDMTSYIALTSLVSKE